MTRLTRTTTLAAVALTALLGLAACSQDGSSTATGPGSGGTEQAAKAGYDAQDVTFATDMEPHHEQAVEMADMILAKSPSAPVRALATAIKAAQEPEIAQLDEMLRVFGVQAGGGTGHGSGHDMSSSGGAGMMTDQDMQALESATGAQAERLFLEGMLAHHEGAVEMATAEIDGGRYPQAVALARSIRTAQQAEITQMEQLLGKG